MTKKKALLAVLLLAVMAFGCAMFAACGAKKYDVNWEIDTQLTPIEITVNSEKADKLPASVKADTTVTFKLEAANGYTVDKYEGVTQRSGVYTLKVKEQAANVKITAKKVVNSITAEGLEKKDYIAGESLDLTGLVVTATYADSSTAVIPKKEGTNSGYTVSPATFEGGETEVVVSYEGKSASIPVTVQYKATIDLNGGKLNNEDAYKEVKGFSYDKEAGIVTFTYLNVETPIVLPTEADVSRTSYAFKGWTGDEIETITSETAQNISLKANWEYAGVTIKTANIVAEGEGEDAKPYLVVTGQFNEGVQSVAVYLRDGGDDTHSAKTIEYGTIAKSADSNEFEAKLDLTKISAEQSLFDRWMDIRFGDPANENIYDTLQIYTDEIEEIEHSKAFVNGYNYLFKSYARADDATPTLKVYYNDAMYTFNVVTEDEVDGQGVSIKFVGSVNDESCYGGTINISWWINGNDPNDSSPIDQNGNFSVTLTVSKVAIGSVGYAHVVIKDKDGKTVVGNTETNLVSSACGNLTELEEQFVIDGDGNKMQSAVTATTEDGLVYYVGNSFWDGILIYARKEKVMLKEATLRGDTVEEGSGEASATKEVVYLVLSGTYSKTVYKTVEEARAGITTNLKIDAQALDTWATVTSEYAPDVVVNEDGTFEILVKLDNAAAGQTVFFHKQLGFDGETTTSNNNLGTSVAAPKIGDTVTSGGLTYTIGDASKLSDDWQKSLIIVNVTAAPTEGE